MSKIIDLSFEIHNLEGDKVTETKEIKENGKKVLDDKKKPKTEKVTLTLKSMLMTLIPIFPKKEKMIDLWDLGLRIKKADGETEFDNDEAALVREVIDENSFPNPVPQPGKDTIERYFPYIIAQTIKYLDGIEAAKKEEAPATAEGK